MSSRKIFAHRGITCGALAGVLSLGLWEAAIAPQPAQAGLWDIFFPPTGRGSASDRNRGGAIRGNCSATNASDAAVADLVALIPNNDVGKTTSAFPTFWLYLPVFQIASSDPAAANQAPVSVKQGRFTLLDDRGLPVLKSPILVKLPEKSGFSRFTLPEDAWGEATSAGLVEGKQYTWFFTISCDPNAPAKNIGVRGRITRISPPTSLVAQLQKSTDQNRYEAYLQNGIWFDGLTLLSEQRQTVPNSWTELLKALDLSKAEQAPIAVLEPIKRSK